MKSVISQIRGVLHALVTWSKPHEIDVGVRDGVTAAEASCFLGLKREITKLRRANEAPKLVSTFFVQAEPDCRLESWGTSPMPIGDTSGVAPICRVLQITPSGHRHHAGLRRNASQRHVCWRHNEALRPRIACV